MPYKNPSKQRAFQKKWIAKRRSDHFKGKHCARCGKAISSKTAELDHKKPQHQQDKHKIWSLKKSKIKKATKGTQILCSACHKKKTKKDIGKMHENTNVAVAKVTMRYLMETFLFTEKECKDTIKGGLADGKCDSDFDKKELAMGAEDEGSEHTKGNDKKSKERAKEIAKDHLTKDPKYYTHLKQKGL